MTADEITNAALRKALRASGLLAHQADEQAAVETLNANLYELGYGVFQKVWPLPGWDRPIRADGLPGTDTEYAERLSEPTHADDPWQTPYSHPAVTLVGSLVPAHVPGAYPNLSCCGGIVKLVEA